MSKILATLIVCQYVSIMSIIAQTEGWKFANDLSSESIAARGLSNRVVMCKQKIVEAQKSYGTSYSIRLRVAGSFMGIAEYPGSEVFTSVVRDNDMRVASFVLTVSARFLEKESDTLLEHSILHEIAHIMNDDLEGYHRQGVNIEIAEERVVYDLVGEKRYREFVKAYTAYKSRPFGLSEDEFIAKVRTIKLITPSDELDDADMMVAKFFREITNPQERILVFNGKLHDISRYSRVDRVEYDPEKFAPILKEGKSLIFFHNHPSDSTLSMFPNANDFEVAGNLEFCVKRQHPHLTCEFRIVSFGHEITVVSYGFKKQILDRLKRNAEHWNQDATSAEFHQKLLERAMYQEVLDEYLSHICPRDLRYSNPEICTTHPKYFLWPSEKYFLKYRGVIR